MLRTITSHAARRRRRVGLNHHQGHSGLAPPSTLQLPAQVPRCLSCGDEDEDRRRRHGGARPHKFHSFLDPCGGGNIPPSPSSSSSSLTLLIGSNVIVCSHSTRLPDGLVASTLQRHQLQQQELQQHPSLVQRRTKVFVSRHNNTLDLSPQSITSYVCSQLPHLDRHTDFRVTTSHVILRECPFCSKPTGDRADNMHKLYVALGSGAYFCHRCGASGSWYDFKSELGGFVIDGNNNLGDAGDGNARNHCVGNGASQSRNRNASINQGTRYSSARRLNGNCGNNSGGRQQRAELLPMPPRKLNSIYASRLLDPSVSPHSEEHEALEYLTQTRGLSKSVLRKYGVGCARYNFPNKDTGLYESGMCMTFPWMMRCGEVAEQELLRGAEFAWGEADAEKKKSDARVPSSEYKKRRKKPSEMTPLERYRHRRELKDRVKATKEEVAERGESRRCHESNAPAEGDPSDNGDRGPSSQEEEDDDENGAAEALHGPYIPRRIKVRSVRRKSDQRLDPPGGGFGLFGWHTVPPSAASLVLTEGEFDAMAVYQATGRPAVSLPNGCRSLPVEVLAMLERFATIYLWMDDDGPGREGAEMFARKLGAERCLVVRPSGRRGRPGRQVDHNNDGSGVDDSDGDAGGPPWVPKDANEALLTGWDMNELLEEANELPHERILKFSDLRDQVIHEIVNPEKYQGAPIPSLPGFTSLIKGFRRGEMTVLTGATGSGKTTFLGQASLDLAEQGINVLWGSFEIKNTRLMQKLLQQYTKDVLPMGIAGNRNLTEEEKHRQTTALNALADRFESLPMHFMKFHGGSDVDDVLDAMEYAAYVHDTEHIILDNMQFMISRQAFASGGRGSSYDKFDMQDVAIEKFRKFATDYNVHVTLVVHPRKEDEGARLGISSFYGSAKATQEADTVIILQSDGKRKFVDVKKNRFDGTLGHVPLYFQRRSGRYSEAPEASLPQRTMVPSIVSAVDGVQKQLNGSAKASSAVYEDIRSQHPR